MVRGLWIFFFVVFVGCSGSVDGGDAGDGDDAGNGDAPPADDGAAGDAAGDDAGMDGDQESADDGGNSAWTAPVGIPPPGFCMDQTVETHCANCTVRNQSDLDNLSGIPAGTVVVITGGPFSGGELTIGGNGTPGQPIFVRGPDSGSRPVISRSTGIVGSYVIVENIDFDFNGGDISLGIRGDHICLRHSEVHNFDPGHNSTTVYVSDSTDIVIYDNYIHDNGDFTVPGEQDVHGIGAGNSHRIWILDNHMHNNRGDSMQFGHRAGNTLGDFYVGRNDLYSDGENCVDIKEASNVVISENTLHDPADGMPAVVLHDCPLNAAAIYNEIYSADTGVSMASLESACDSHVPVSLFVIRNRIHDINGQGIQGWGSGKRYYVTGNTFTNVTDPTEIDNAGAGSIISEVDDGLSDAFDAFFAVYGIDISNP